MNHQKIFKLYILSKMYISTYNLTSKRIFSSLLFRKSHGVIRQLMSLNSEYKRICSHSGENTPNDNHSADIMIAIDLLFNLDELEVKRSINFLNSFKK